jgi:hypothetical protein
MKPYVVTATATAGGSDARSRRGDASIERLRGVPGRAQVPE